MEKLIALADNRWFRLVMVGLVVLGLQTTIFNEMRPFGVSIQVMVLLAAASGLARGSEVGAISGFIVGLLYDLVLTTPLGLGAAVCAVVGFSAGYAHKLVIAPTWWMKMGLASAASALGMFLMPVMLEITGTDGALTTQVFVIALVVSVFNALFSIPAQWICRWALREQVAR